MGTPSAGAPGLHAEVFIGAFLSFQRGKGTFAATTSTLVCGASDAVLIDAQHIRSELEGHELQIVEVRQAELAANRWLDGVELVGAVLSAVGVHGRVSI